jgi:hypothetical protein
LLLFISLWSSGGCEFGGGGDEGSNFEIVEGTVTSIIPTNIPIEGTFVVINDNIFLSELLDDTGFFFIQGLFSGPSVRLDFREQEEPPSFATTFLNVYRGARLELGTINILNGNVIFNDPIITNFDATVIENNCVVNSGNIEVQTRDKDPIVFVIVTITPTTLIVDKNNNPKTCQDIGTKVGIRGILETGNNVTAGRLELKN